MTNLEVLQLWSAFAPGECDLEHSGEDRPEDRSYTARISPGPMQQTGARLKWYGPNWGFDEGSEGTLLTAVLGFAWARGWYFNVSAFKYPPEGQGGFGVTAALASTREDDVPRPTTVEPRHLAWHAVVEYVGRLSDPYPRQNAWEKGPA